MNKPEPQFKIGDHVESRHSGKVYIVLAVWPSDETGCYTYAIRGWRGGRHYGPKRDIGESGLRLPVTQYELTQADLDARAASIPGGKS